MLQKWKQNLKANLPQIKVILLQKNYKAEKKGKKRDLRDAIFACVNSLGIKKLN